MFLFEVNPNTDTLNVWIEFLKTITTVGGTVICAWLGNRIWQKRKENATTELTDTPEHSTDTPVFADARLDALEKVIETLVEDLTTRFDTRQQVLIAVLNALDVACWESDEHGQCVFASTRLSELIGSPISTIHNDGWMSNLIATEPGEKKVDIINLWEFAVQKHITFKAKYGFKHDDDKIVKVRAIATPIVVKGKLKGFIGVLEEVK